LPPTDGPLDAEAILQCGDRQAMDVVTGQLQRALAANGGLSVIGEGGQAIQFLENGQEGMGGFDALEVAEALVMLVEAPNNQFHGVVGFGDDLALNGVDQLEPVALQEVEDGGRAGGI
jgi:hypothetical protein